MLNIVADENMPLLQERFGGYGQVTAVPGRKITASLLKNCDVLLVRSVTRVNRALLAGSRVRFVGSATSGIDHVDTAYLQNQGITFAHAPGCNARAVVQYMVAVFCAAIPHWRQKTFGIVGCGQVGGRLYRTLKAMGLNCRVYDPYLEESFPELTSLEQALAADVICLHTPLSENGPHPTRHMVDARALSQIKPGTFLINTSRGAVVDNQALSQHLDTRPHKLDGLNVVLDVWEKEPDIDMALAGKLILATPHIAGYSLDGRRRGTEMVFQAFCKWQGRANARQVEEEGGDQALTVLEISQASLEDYVLATFDVTAESRRMAAELTAGKERDSSHFGAAFDQLRKTCPTRREFSHYRVVGVDHRLAEDLHILGFNVD